MAVGDLITAARFNNLQSRINTIMGVGSGTSGYGQDLQSSLVITSSEIRASDMSSLYVDMTRARFHQTGFLTTEIENILVEDLIIDDNSVPLESKSFAAFENLMLKIEADKFLLAITPLTSRLESGITSSRTTVWNGTLSYIFTVQFANENERRFFFNSGGEIRISSNISGGSGQKTNNWRDVLSNTGVVKFDYDKTVSTGTGNGSGIGNYDLTNSYQRIFNKSGSLNYSENEYNIYVKLNSASVIQFKVDFVDADTGDPNIDENVNGTISSSIQHLRAFGDYVEVNAPNYSNVTPLG